MRLLASTDFSLRILMYLAVEPGRMCNTDQLARALRISRNHLQKVVQALVAGGFVLTVKGARGGVLLARPPDAISVGAVVRWFEARQPIVACFDPDADGCVLLPMCGLRQTLGDAQDVYFRFLDRFTIAACLPGIAARPSAPS